MIKSESRIDKSRYDKVLWSRVCPGCRAHRVVDIARRAGEDALNPGKYLGSFHQCGGPRGHRCWHMTKFDVRRPDRPLYERFGG